MKILRRGLIVLLVVANIGLVIYALKGIKEPVQEVPAPDVKIVKTIEQTKAMEHPYFKPKEYVAEIPEGDNIALKKPITSNGVNDVYKEIRANDGDAAGASYWEGVNNYPNTLTVDLEQPAKIHSVRITLCPLPIWGKRVQNISVMISNDGANFTELVPARDYTFDPNAGNEATISFDEIETRYVQLVITSNTGANGGQVAEFEVYSK